MYLSADSVVILIGNKADNIQQGKITWDKSKEFSDIYNIPCIETNAIQVRSSIWSLGPVRKYF